MLGFHHFERGKRTTYMYPLRFFTPKFTIEQTQPPNGFLFCFVFNLAKAKLCKLTSDT